MPTKTKRYTDSQRASAAATLATLHSDAHDSDVRLMANSAQNQLDLQGYGNLSGAEMDRIRLLQRLGYRFSFETAFGMTPEQAVEAQQARLKYSDEQVSSMLRSPEPWHYELVFAARERGFQISFDCDLAQLVAVLRECGL